MSERLSPKQLEELREALDDGFRDDYLPGGKMVRVKLGALFHTNPLSEEYVYYRASDGLNEARLRDAVSSENLDEDGLFGSESWETEMFWRHSFGFNLDKLEAYFAAREDEVISDYKRRFQEYLEGWDYSDVHINDYGEEDGLPHSFNQWIEGRIYPYTRRWFERHIIELIRAVRGAEREIRENAPPLGFAQEFHLKSLMRKSVELGRMVEHYRWKFSYEDAALAGIQSAEVAKVRGQKGGEASGRKRVENLLALMSEIEALGDMFPRVSEEAIFAQAYANAAAKRKMPKSRKVVEDYGVAIRSEVPFKERFDAIFRKNA